MSGNDHHVFEVTAARGLWHPEFEDRRPVAIGICAGWRKMSRNVQLSGLKGLAWLDIHMLRSMQRTRGEAPQARHQPNKALMRLAGSRISLGRQMRLQLASVARAGFSAAIWMN